MDKIKIVLLFIAIALSFSFIHGQAIGNYVNNGSFEERQVIYPMLPNENGSKYWGPCTPNNFCYNVYSTAPPSNTGWLPYSSFGFQYPRTGKNIILTSFYCDLSTCGAILSRGYLKNTLKEPLKSNVEYCVKYHVVNTNNCVVAMDSYGAYFGDQSLDTINYCALPLTYLNPQIENTTGIITDTLNWIPITGTFVATGIEKYMLLGNFKSNANTNTVVINPFYLPSKGTDLYIDDVSVIQIDLPAYASPDTLIYLGDSTFIGRQSDFAIDPGCIWYKLPNMTTALDTISGLWVKPTATSTYVVRQELDCSSLKWDTVVVTISTNYVGLDKLRQLSDNTFLFPNPTSSNLIVTTSADIVSFNITNNLGQMVRENEIEIKNNSATISTSDLASGLYQIHFKTKFGLVTKKFVKTN